MRCADCDGELDDSQAYYVAGQPHCRVCLQALALLGHEVESILDEHDQ